MEMQGHHQTSIQHKQTGAFMPTTYTLTPADIIDYEVYCAHHVPVVIRIKNRTRTQWIAISAVLLGILVLLIYLQVHWLLLLPIVWLVVMAITILLNHLLLLDYSIKKMVEKATKKGKYKNLLAAQTISIDQKTFTVSTDGVETRRDWSVVRQLTILEKHIYIFIADNCAHIVPKHAFQDETAFDSFAQLVRRYYDNARKL